MSNFQSPPHKPWTSLTAARPRAPQPSLRACANAGGRARATVVPQVADWARRYAPDPIFSFECLSLSLPALFLDLAVVRKSEANATSILSFQTPYYPGINYNEDKGPLMNGIAIGFISLSFATLILRFGSRLYTRVPLWIDDWLIVAAAILSWAYSTLVIAAVQCAFYGQHIGHSNPQAATLFGKQLYALAILYPPALVLSKLSLIALYWRIFRVDKSAKVAMIVGAVLNILWGVAAFLVGIFNCWPVSANWDPTVAHKCIDYPPFFLSNEAITITLDLVVLLMPLFWISKIQRTLAERVSISVTFAIGLVATVISAVRLYELVKADRLPPDDATFTESAAALWAIIELNIWILVASIPALRPAATRLYRKHFAVKPPSRYSYRGATNSTYGSGGPFSNNTTGKKSWYGAHSSNRRDGGSVSNAVLTLAPETFGGGGGAQRGNPLEGESSARAGSWGADGEGIRGDEVWLGNLGSVRVERSVEVRPQRMDDGEDGVQDEEAVHP